MLPLDLVDERDAGGWRMGQAGARRSGTPFISFFRPDDMLALAREAGFRAVRHGPGLELDGRYLGGRTDGLRASTGEDFLIATASRRSRAPSASAVLAWDG